MTVAEKEMEAAYSELRKQGYKETVFDFDYAAPGGSLTGDSKVRADVIATCTENHVQKVYKVASGETWVRNFSADLRAGVFGHPPDGAPDRKDPLSPQGTASP
jgi:hypothetical protein